MPVTWPEPVVAVVVAAGSGVRLGASRPKALVEVGGRPLVHHAVSALLRAGVGEIVVVIPDGAHDLFAAALSGLGPVRLVVGGALRQQSVRNGLAALGPTGRVVLVHDAARPLVPVDVVVGVIEAVLAGADAVIPAVDVVDTIRGRAADGWVNVDRSTLRAVQTPQGFRRDVLVDSHEAAAGMDLTDDAAVCERSGHHVVLVPGSPEGIKVTRPIDVALAEAILSARAVPA